ncbi:S-adenosyl-L-methionine-dependent methyltransferase [Chlamydoabsidia padenii]|nr:S-adenosyl-L-methionine-dependent methyltransferase [Chlamydoabsidia padenii]
MPDTIIHVKTTVTAGGAGQRIRKWLMTHYRQVVTSRENAHQSFKRGEITVNGQVSEETRILQENDEVEIHYNKTQEQLLKLKDVKLDIGYQDEQLAIVWKEPGTNFNTVEQAVRLHFGDQDQIWFPYVLQKAASGWLLMSKTKGAKEWLMEYYQKDEIKLGMIILCHGQVPPTGFDDSNTTVDTATDDVVAMDAATVEDDLEKPTAPIPKSSRLFRSFEVTKVTRSNNSDSISTVKLGLRTPWGSPSVRRFFFHHNHPIIGNSAATRPVKTHKDKGLYMTLHTIDMYSQHNNRIQLERPEPDKFSLIRDREHRFWKRACDRRLAELTQAGVELDHVESYGKEPLAYVLGEKTFYDLRFEIDKNCLIPRPSTETLVDAALAWLKTDTPRRILDLGTGCGNLLLSILTHHPTSIGWGVDISTGAIAKAEINKQQLNCTDRAHFIIKDMALLTLADDLDNEPVDLIVCNPPYLSSSSQQQQHGKATQQDLALAFEPPEALYADDDGLAWYVTLSELAPRLLHPRGRVVLECGKGMVERVRLLWSGWSVVETLKDKQGWDRCLVLEKSVDKD